MATREPVWDCTYSKVTEPAEFEDDCGYNFGKKDDTQLVLKDLLKSQADEYTSFI